MDFIGRRRELAALHDEFGSQKPSLVITYGRRRIGKSRLIREAAKDRPAVLFQATRVSPALNLEGFKAEIEKALGPSAILNSISNWEGTLHFLADVARDRYPGLVVLIDEFPYITDGDPALPSIIQRFWDSGAPEAGKLKLVLCGSAISQMKGLMAEPAPLYGRKTMTLAVRQLSLREAALFFPEYDAQDVIRTYAVFGGIPHYLQLCDNSKPLRDNIIDLLLQRTGTLVDEPNILLQAEGDVREPLQYSSILAAVSEGYATLKDIGDRLKGETKSYGPYLTKLQALDLLRNERSLDADDRSRNQRFSVNDSLVAFWHRFVRPNLSAIEAGEGAELYDMLVARSFSEYMGSAFEVICRDFIALHAKEIMGASVRKVGHIWGHPDYDIDVAGELLDGTFFYGECKWRSAPVDRGILQTLAERAEGNSYGRGKSGKKLLLFSRLGFRPELSALQGVDAAIHLLDPDRIVFGERRSLDDRPVTKYR